MSRIISAPRLFAIFAAYNTATFDSLEKSVGTRIFMAYRIKNERVEKFRMYAMNSLLFAIST
ncbi:MAG: hypothetical protein SCALA701_21270 [Candidatus Scalindua sp.]|nr:MAG: hypothetical protein SCALA701_21270 [Candidatus Scalindua sp.]